MAATTAGSTPAAAPTRPAWAAPTTPARGSASSTGTQSAASTASPTPGSAVTAASVAGWSGLPGAGRRVDDRDPGAVHLLQEHHGHAQLGRQSGAVGRDGAGRVADPGGQVERGVHAAGPPACAGGHDPADAGHGQRSVTAGVSCGRRLMMVGVS